MADTPIDEAIREAEALVVVLKTLAELPDEESRARVVALVIELGRPKIGQELDAAALRGRLGEAKEPG